MAYPTLRQVAFGSTPSNTEVTTVSANFTQATLAGSTILVCATCSNFVGHTIGGVADPVNGAYTLVRQTIDTGNQAQATYVKQNAASISTAQAITSTPTGTEDYQGICIMEFTGVPTSGVIVGSAGQDVTTTGSTANNISSGTAAMGAANITLVGFFQNDGSGHSPYVPSAGTGFTSQGTSWVWNTGQVNFLVETQNVANPGTIAATATASGADTFVAQSVGILGTGGASATGSAALTEAHDTVLASGSATSTASGAAAITESHDSSAGSGSAGVSGAAAVTEALDTIAAAGSAGSGAGTAAITETPDVAAGLGSTSVFGTAAIAESPDLVAASGSAPILSPATGFAVASASGVLSTSILIGGAGSALASAIAALTTQSPTLTFGASAATHAAAAVVSASTIGVTTQNGSGYFVGVISLGTVVSLNDTLGNQYTLIQSQAYRGVATAYLYFCPLGNGGPGHAVSVNVIESAPADISLFFQEIQSSRGAGLTLDANGVNYATSSPYVTNAISTTRPNEALLAFFGGYSASNPATLGVIGGLNLLATETNGGVGTEAVGGFAGSIVSSLQTGFNAAFTQVGSTVATSEWDFSDTQVTFDNPAYTFDSGTGAAAFLVSVYAAPANPLGAAVASAVANASAYLNTGYVLTAGGRAVASSVSSLTNFSSVVLTAPAYVGIGGIYDPNFWGPVIPQVGETLYFDPAITVLADGEIISATNPVIAQVGFYDAYGNWWPGTVFLTTGLVIYANAIASATASLTTFPGGLGGYGAAIASASSALTTSILLAASGSAVASATSALSTSIQLAAQAQAIASGTVVLGQTAQFMAAGKALASATAALQLAQQLVAAGQGIASAATSLTHGALLYSAAQAVAQAAAALSTSIRIGGAGQSVASSQATLTVARSFTAAGSALASAQAILSASIRLGGSGSATASASSALAVGHTFVAAGQGVASALTELITPKAFTAIGQGIASAATSLNSNITFEAHGIAVPFCDPELTTMQSPTGMYVGDVHFMANDRSPFLPQVLTLARTAERIVTFDFTFDLAAGESLAGVATQTVECTAGADINPVDIVNGIPSFNVGMTQVLLPVSGLSANVGCDYYIAMTSPTTNLLKVLTRYALIQVRN